MNIRTLAKTTANEILLSFVYATIWFVTLFAISYPVDEWVGVVVVAYVSLCISRVVVANLAYFLLVKLLAYGTRVMERGNVERRADAGGDSKRGVHTMFTLFLGSVLAAIFGANLAITAIWTTVAGLPPLAPAFAYVGWAMLALGATSLALFFAGLYLLFTGAEALSSKMSVRVSEIERSEPLLKILGARPAALSASD